MDKGLFVGYMATFISQQLGHLATVCFLQNLVTNQSELVANSHIFRKGTVKDLRRMFHVSDIETLLNF